jgi:hypothetical protein
MLKHNHASLMQVDQSDFVIDLKKRDSFKPRIEVDEEFRVSSYLPIYHRGLDLARRVVENTRELEIQLQNNNREGKAFQPDAFLGGFDYNNIIAFIGGRGSGKTSLMLSFQKMLHYGPKVKDLSFSDDDPLKAFQWPQFKAVETIDPAAFENKERIIEIFISRLYHDFADEVERRGNKGSDRELTGKILESFRKVLDGIRLLRDPGLALKDDTAGMDKLLDQLDQLGTGPTLKKSIRDLVEYYLEFWFGDKRKESFLLIAIDDADLNLGNSVQLLEDLRKYLRQPRLLILVAMRQDQILANLAKEFMNQYKELNASHRFDDPRNMADAYLRKLIPETARLTMPFSDLRIKAHRVGIRVTGFGGIDTVDQEGLNGKAKFPTLFSFLQTLMRRKLAFTLSESLYNGEHPFVPDSLRELYDLVNELSEWRDFVPDYPFSRNGNIGHLSMVDWIADRRFATGYQPQFVNHNRFINYIVNVWAVGKISYTLRAFLAELASIDFKAINKCIVTQVKPIVDAHFLETSQQRTRRMAEIWKPSEEPLRIPNQRNYRTQNFEELVTMFQAEANPAYMGTGEVIVLLRLIDDNYNNEEIARFTFAIRAVYSMRAMDALFKDTGGERNGLLPFVARMIGDQPLPPEAFRVVSSPYVGMPGDESNLIKIHEHEKLAKLFADRSNSLLRESESAQDHIDCPVAVYATSSAGNSQIKVVDSPSLELLSWVRAWVGFHFFAFWGNTVKKNGRNLGAHAELKSLLSPESLDDVGMTSDPSAPSLFGLQPGKKLILHFGFEHVFKSSISNIWGEFGLPNFEDRSQANPSKFKDWRFNGLPNFPIWDLEGLEELMDKVLSSVRNISIRKVLKDVKGAGLSHQFLLLRCFLRTWDAAIGEYVRETFGNEEADVSHIDTNRLGNRVGLYRFDEHPLLQYLCNDFSPEKDDSKLTPIGELSATRKLEREAAKVQSYFSEFLQFGREGQEVENGPELLREKTIKHFEWLLASRSKYTGYFNSFRDAIDVVKNNVFPPRMNRDEKLGELRKIRVQFEEANKAKKLNFNERRDFGRRFLNILQSLAVE